MSTDNNTGNSNSAPDAGRRSPGLAVLGIAALGVATWGLFGGPDLPDLADLGWIAVAVGLIAGLALIVTGTRSRS